MASPLGPVLDGLGCTVRLKADDLVSSAVVLLEVIDGAGCPVLRICDSAGMSWLSRRGMLETALDAERGVHATGPTAG